MKLHIVGTANRRISNIEPQNVEGWNRFAQSFELIKTDRIPSFDIRYSLFGLGSKIGRCWVSRCAIELIKCRLG
jgi:hypothetical protein